MNPLVSIIVPVYNAGKYLCRCLDSIINQTYQNIEIIVVDDGSKDSSGQICDEYASKDLRFLVIHKENGGVASARQTGLDSSKGEYVIHADPDDWVEPNWIEELLAKIVTEDVDIVMCNYYIEKNSGSIIADKKPTSLLRKDLLSDLLFGRIWTACWNKLVKRSTFQKLNISFIPEMTLGEDLYVFTEMIYKGASFSYLSTPLYHYDYYSNPESIVRKPRIDQVYSMKIYLDHFERLLQDDCFSEAFYRRKKLLKERCFRAGKEYGHELISFFSEINERYISENKFQWHFIRAYRGDTYLMERICIAQCLKGNINWGYWLYKWWCKYATVSFRNLIILPFHKTVSL